MPTHRKRHVDAPETDVVVPGDAIPSGTTVEAGVTFAWGGVMRSAVAGQLMNGDSGNSGGIRHTVRVSRKRSALAPSVLSVGDVIIGRVTRITPRLAHVEILCVNEAALRESCAGLLRREDVRPPTQRDGVEMHRCVRPGDVLLASVLSLGDSRAYYLSTTANEHGVVIARSSEGATMRPISYCEMECPLTRVREKRKVAKPPGTATAGGVQTQRDTASLRGTAGVAGKEA